MRRLACVLALLLGACAAEPEPASPALWEVAAPGGGTGWLMGTIHALERPAAWQGPKVAQALAAADTIVTELGPDEDAAANARVLADLSQSPGLPPLAERVPVDLRPALRAQLDRAGTSEAAQAQTETWAVALMLARSASPPGGGENGIDRVVLAARGQRPVVALEGAQAQLSLFDRLPEAEQRDLLAIALRDAGKAGNEVRALAEAWRKGDMARIELATREGLLADPELREVLFTARNQAWSGRIAGLLEQGKRPFVAVGAAHMAGPEGLPALLAAQGLAVRRVQ